MPAKAGIQEDLAPASDYVPWILGLALLAQNDVIIAYPHIYGVRLRGFLSIRWLRLLLQANSASSEDYGKQKC